MCLVMCLVSPPLLTVNFFCRGAACKLSLACNVATPALDTAHSARSNDGYAATFEYPAVHMKIVMLEIAADPELE